MIGYFSESKLNERLDLAERSPEKSDLVAFHLYEDARTKRIFAAMYMMEESMGMSLSPDAKATGVVAGESMAKYTLREAKRDFGETAEEMFKNVNEFFNGSSIKALKKLGLDS